MNQATKKSLVEVLREGRASDWRIKLTNYFPNLDDLVEIRYEWSKFEGLNARYHLEDFFVAHKKFTYEPFCYFDEGSFRPSFYSDIEYAPKKYTSCLEQGSFFLTHPTRPDVRFLVYVSDSRYDRITEITITTARSHRQECEKLFREFREYIIAHNIYKGQKLTGKLTFIDSSTPYTWDDLLLDDKTASLLHRNLTTVLRNKDRYKELGASAKRGIILSGPPGTGKTMLGKILCQTMPEWTFLWVSPGDLGRPDDLKRYCDLVKATAPSILFLEDLDLHFQSRDSASFNTMLGELMNQLDGVEDVSNVVVIGTTNRPEELEKALAQRPGRFDKIIKFGEPTSEVRQKMFEVFAKGRLATDVEWDQVLKASDKFTGAQIKETINQAVLDYLDNSNGEVQAEELKLTTETLLRAIAACKGKDFTPTVGFAARLGDSFDY